MVQGDIAQIVVMPDNSLKQLSKFAAELAQVETGRQGTLAGEEAQGAGGGAESERAKRLALLQGAPAAAGDGAGAGTGWSMRSFRMRGFSFRQKPSV